MLKNNKTTSHLAVILKPLVKYLLIIFPSFSFGQSGICTINIHFSNPSANGRQIELAIRDSTKSAIIKNNSGGFRTELDQPFLARLNFRHAQHGQPYYWYEHINVFLQPGFLDINVNTDSLITAQMKGPSLTVDYNEKLYKPVMYDNAEIQRCQLALEASIKSSNSDTTQLKTQLTNSIKKCFEVPQTYIKANPNSSLSLIAINMLGKGDSAANLTIDDIQNLYNSLSDSVKNSELGLQCAEKLQWLKNN